MYEFNYHRPNSVAAARETLAGATDGQLMAGGMTLIPTLKQRLAQPSDVIDMGRIPDLAGIKRDGEALVVGAMTLHGDVAGSSLVRETIPGLAALAEHIGDPQVRNRGTIGGSIANADPAADYPAALVGLGATVETDTRTIAADDFFTGMFETALADGEIITAVRFPIAKRSAYAKFPNPASRYAIAGVFVAELADGSPRVAVTGAGSSVFRVSAMEAALASNWSPDAVAGVTIPDHDLNEDIHASAEYRAHLVTVMAKRAVAAAG